LELRIVESRQLFEEKAMTLESKLLGTLFRLDRHDIKIADILVCQGEMLERIKQLETPQAPN
jgi:hypothetical protein